LVADGATIMLTTQYLDEADQLADRIAVLDSGRIVAEGTPAELKRRVPGGTISLHLNHLDELEAAVRAFPDGVRDNDALTLSLSAGGDVPAIRAVLDRLERSAVTASHLEVTGPGLDEVFLALTGPDARKVAP
jgi:ABC-2 type transport system ATP-binding protein